MPSIQPSRNHDEAAPLPRGAVVPSEASDACAQDKPDLALPLFPCASLAVFVSLTPSEDPRIVTQRRLTSTPPPAFLANGLGHNADALGPGQAVKRPPRPWVDVWVPGGGR